MIDLEEIREVFQQRIYDAAIFPSIQWENIVLTEDQKGELWMSEAYLPVEEGFSDSLNGDRVEGIFQYSINIPAGNYNGVTAATDAAKSLGNLFSTAEYIQTTNYKVSIDSIKRSDQGKLDDGTYTVVLDIEFKGYE